MVNRKDFRPTSSSSKISDKDRKTIQSYKVNPHVKRYLEYNREEEKPVVETARAINERGYTKNSNEGGYIMENGEMLDFSGRNNATGYKNRKPINSSGIGKDDYLANNRNADHREVSQYINDNSKEDTDNIRTFCKSNNAIRMNDSGDLYLELYSRPTYAQMMTIQRIKKKQGIIIVDKHYKGKLESKEYKTWEEFNNDI